MKVVIAHERFDSSIQLSKLDNKLSAYSGLHWNTLSTGLIVLWLPFVWTTKRSTWRTKIWRQCCCRSVRAQLARITITFILW